MSEGQLPAIAHFMPWPSMGGVEIATARLMAATRDRFRHVAFCMPNTPELRAACEQAGAETVEYVPPEPSLRHGDRFYRESALVARELKRMRVDLAHCAETKAAYHNSLAALVAGVPMISHVRSRYSTVSFRERLTFLPLKRYVFVSENSRQQFGVKVPDRKARVLYDAVEFTEPPADAPLVRAELGIPEAAPLIGMVARVNPQKDYDTLADAAALVLAKRPDARFVVVGDNADVPLNREHYAHVHGRLSQLGIADKFVFTGFRSDVPRLVAALDVFVLCTHREGLPLAILEAMGMGKPVIATAVDGIPEVMTEGVTGLMHKHKDSAGLAEQILRCIEGPEWARDLGLAARKHVRATYNVETYARNVATIYDELLA